VLNSTYFAKLKEVKRLQPERWVDAHDDEQTHRLASAARLTDQRPALQRSRVRTLLGDDAYALLSKTYSDAHPQEHPPGTERPQLQSSSPDRRHLGNRIHTVSIEPGKEKQFERLWLTALSAYAKVSPLTIFSVSQTLVGGGPQYVVTRPLKTHAEADSFLSPARAVELAFGVDEARAFAKDLSGSVNKWETLVLDRTDLDSHGTHTAPHGGK
jgi:hypothetical protein